MYSCRLLLPFIGLHCILILYHVYISPLAIYISDTPPDWACGAPHSLLLYIVDKQDYLYDLFLRLVLS